MIKAYLLNLRTGESIDVIDSSLKVGEVVDFNDERYVVGAVCETPTQGGSNSD